MFNFRAAGKLEVEVVDWITGVIFSSACLLVGGGLLWSRIADYVGSNDPQARVARNQIITVWIGGGQVCLSGEGDER